MMRSGKILKSAAPIGGHLGRTALKKKDILLKKNLKSFTKLRRLNTTMKCGLHLLPSDYNLHSVPMYFTFYILIKWDVYSHLTYSVITSV